MAIPNTAQLIAAIFSELNGDGTLTALLGTYDPGTGAVPSIFSGFNVPSEAGSPWIAIRPVVARSTSDTKQQRGVTFTIDIEVFSDDQESTVEMNSIVDQVADLLHRNRTMTLATDDLIDIQMTGLTEAPTEDNLTGAILTFDFLVMEPIT